jgi:hypothetical protein
VDAGTPTVARRVGLLFGNRISGRGSFRSACGPGETSNVDINHTGLAGRDRFALPAGLDRARCMGASSLCVQPVVRRESIPAGTDFECLEGGLIAEAASFSFMWSSS